MYIEQDLMIMFMYKSQPEFCLNQLDSLVQFPLGISPERIRY